MKKPVFRRIADALVLRNTALVKRWRGLGSLARIYVMIALIVMSNVAFTFWPLLDHIKAAPPVKMYLLWDPSSGLTFPSAKGWHIESNYNGRLIRGDEANKFGTVGNISNYGAATTQTTVVSRTITALNTTGNYTSAGNATPGNASGTDHTHTLPTATVAAQNFDGGVSINNYPAYQGYQLMYYDDGSNNGIPNEIPRGAIALFDDSPGIPPGWTRVSALDNKFAAATATTETKGNDTKIFNVSWTTGTTGVSTPGSNVTCVLCGTNPAADEAHTHTISGGVSSTVALPVHINMLFAKADADTPTLSVGLTGMFDNDPGGGWVIRSNPGGSYYQQFLRGSSVFSATSTGSNTITPNNAVITTGIGSASGNNANALGQTLAAPNHTHTVSVGFSQIDITPPFFNVVIAEKVNFILQATRWYDQAIGSLQVNSPWSNLDIAPNTRIRTLPTANDPPDVGRSLRLRAQILVNGNNLALMSVSFKLQYRNQTSDQCTDTTGNGGPWVDVADPTATSAAWRYYDNNAGNTPNDGDNLTGTSVLGSTFLQNYVASTGAANLYAFKNPFAAVVGDTIEYDFDIENHSALPASQYAFRIVEASTNLLLSSYQSYPANINTCPILVTKPASQNLMRHGNFFEEQGERGFQWIN